MMKRHRFTTIEEVQQAHYLLQTGTLVARRKQGFYTIELFQLPDCYLEVFRHTHFNVIIKVNRFSDTSYLDPYLKSINIRSVIS